MDNQPSLRRQTAGVLGFLSSVAGAWFIVRGLGEAQPLVTFGVLPTPEDVARGRDLLTVAAAITVAGGAVIAATGQRLHGLAVALPGPAAFALTHVGPANRGSGWAALLLSIVACAAAVHAASRDDPGSRRDGLRSPS